MSKSFLILRFLVGIKGSGSSLTLIIILCVIGLILLLILVILCVCYFRRKKKAIVNNNYEGVYSSVRYTATVSLSTLRLSKHRESVFFHHELLRNVWKC